MPQTNLDSNPAPDPKSLRRELRARRRALDRCTQRAHARDLVCVLGREPLFLRARRIGLYWPADGELDPRPLALGAACRGAVLFLPVLRRAPRGGLMFVRWSPGEPLAPNRFGIPEPRRRHRRIALPWTLDLLLLPLVGFDARCNRLGMGGGFYDRTLAYLAQRRYWRRPRLIGVAHACQRVPALAPRPWDVPLDGVATERGLYRRRGP